MSLQVDKGVRTAPSIPEHGFRIIEVDGQWEGRNPPTRFNLSRRVKAHAFARIGWAARGGATPPL